MRCIRLDGKVTNTTDPMRGVWYGNCGYWTDDWDKLERMTRVPIPCCPKCGLPGFQIVWADWSKGLTEYSNAYPSELGYDRFVMDSKEYCLKLFGGMEKAWKAYKMMREAKASDGRDNGTNSIPAQDH